MPQKTLKESLSLFKNSKELEQQIARALELGHQLRNGGLSDEAFDEFTTLSETLIDEYL